MQEIIIHLLKSAGLVSLFYIVYYFLLRNDTSFKTNRFFLLGGMITSLLLPFLKINRTVVVETQAAGFLPEIFSEAVFETSPLQPATIDWWQFAGIFYLTGLSFFMLKFLLELFSLLKLILTSNPKREKEFHLLSNPGTTQPFSFFKYVVLDPNQHSPAELDLILKHEGAHVRQWHSIDQLLSSLCMYLLWFNPLCWKYRKNLVQNLEYLADREVMQAKVSKKAYQATLLKISVGNVQSALTNNFYQSFIKKRIMMLNKNTSEKTHFWKVSLLLPFLLGFVLLFNVNTVAQGAINNSAGTNLTSEVEFAATISKNTSRESLSKFKNLFEKRGVALEFKNLVFSREGFLTSINIAYTIEAQDQSGNISLNDPAGIPATIIYKNKNKFGYRPAEDPNASQHSLFHKLGKEPLFIVSGKEYSAKKLAGKKIQINGQMTVLGPEKAQAQYGTKAKNGAVILSEGIIIDNFKESLKQLDLQKGNFKTSFIEVNEGAAPTVVGVDIKTTESNFDGDTGFNASDFQYRSKTGDIPAIHRENSEMEQVLSQEPRPLIVVNGDKKDKDFDISAIDPATIRSLNVLKDKAAVEKYGAGAKHGVIEVTLKTAEELKASKENSEVRTESGNIHFTVGSIKFEEDNQKKISVRDVGLAHPDAPRALYVVDGKVMDQHFDANSIASENIESILILKDAKATEKYGEKAKNGVIEIITKKQ